MLAWIFAAVCMVLAWLVFKAYFTRDPPRQIQPGSFIVSPADGIVGTIFRTGEKEKGQLRIKKGVFGKIRASAEDVAKKAVVICIVMRVWDVHVQRSPIDGKVTSVKYRKGNFLNAVKDPGSMAAFENEKNEILIEGKGTRAKVIQIAGLVARRIECFVRPKDSLLKGVRIGRINLGSQVVLILPDTVKVKVREGQKVYGGTTVVAEAK